MLPWSCLCAGRGKGNTARRGWLLSGHITSLSIVCSSSVPLARPRRTGEHNAQWFSCSRRKQDSKCISIGIDCERVCTVFLFVVIYVGCKISQGKIKLSRERLSPLNKAVGQSRDVYPSTPQFDSSQPDRTTNGKIMLRFLGHANKSWDSTAQIAGMNLNLTMQRSNRRNSLQEKIKHLI